MAKFALLIGVSEYMQGLSSLPAAVKDVDALYKLLLHPEIGGFLSSDITLLRNPDRQTMEESIELLFSSRHKDDLVLLYFSGHGIKDDTGKLFLANRWTRKTDKGELVRSSAVSSAFIQESMSRSRSKRQVIILDSCFSGAFAEGLYAKDDGKVDILNQLGGEGRAVLTSSNSTQYSFEQEGEELSFYTRFLVEGIQTGAADRDEDGSVSIDELHEYASQKVREVRPEVNPEIYAIREGFKILISKVPPIAPDKRYRREVARLAERGELSFIGRRTLDLLRTQINLDISEAKAIEDEILEPYRIESRKKLQQYEQVFREAVNKHKRLDEADKEQFKHLQQILGLSEEDILPVEASVIAESNFYKDNLHKYETTYKENLRQDYSSKQISGVSQGELKDSSLTSQEKLRQNEPNHTITETNEKEENSYGNLLKSLIRPLGANLKFFIFIIVIVAVIAAIYSKFSADNEYLATNNEVEDSSLLADTAVGGLYYEESNYDELYRSAKAAKDRRDYSVALSLYENLIKLGYTTEDVYKDKVQLMQKVEASDEDIMNTLAAGVEKQPHSIYLMQEELRYYLKTNRADEAMDKLDKAIVADPSNATLLAVKGNLLERNKDLEGATAIYMKALEIDPNNFDANYNLGVLEFNKGADVNNIAAKMDYATYMKKGKALEVEAKKHYQAAVPYFEKALQIQPKDHATMQNLIKLYRRLERNDDLERISQLLLNG
ncbi:caspase family protein [Pontibacter toksunensis]|uniref:Caspase family protein n=1 Tax=Pontibacter toksunensis TaxID=1332631 RepID=A0ABW6C277_9BACT